MTGVDGNDFWDNAKIGFSGDASVLDVGLMDAAAIQENSHTAVEFTDQQIETVKYQIEQEVRLKQMDPNFSAKDAADLATQIAMATGLDGNFAAQMGEEAFRSSQSLDDAMNTNADGTKNTQQENEHEQGGMFGAVAGMFAAATATLSGLSESAWNSVSDVTTKMANVFRSDPKNMELYANQGIEIPMRDLGTDIEQIAGLPGQQQGIQQQIG